MTPATLRATLSGIGLSQSHAARLLGVNPRTMRRWIAGEQPVPGPADRLLNLLGAGLGVREYLDSLAAPDAPPEPP